MVRPLLLTYINDFVEENESYEYTIDVYKVLIEKWIEREEFNIPLTDSSQFRENMLNFSAKVSQFIYDNHVRNNRMYISADEIDKFAIQYEIPIKGLFLKSRSLLHRGEEDHFRFAHRTILEFFLSQHLFENREFLFQFKKESYDQALSFYVEKCITEEFTPFIRDSFPLERYSKNTIGYSGGYTVLCEDIASTFGIDYLHVISFVVIHKKTQEWVFDWKKFTTQTTSIMLDGNERWAYEKKIVVFRNLKYLTVYNCHISNVEFLRSLKLKRITFINCTYDLTTIAQLKRIQLEPLQGFHFTINGKNPIELV